MRNILLIAAVALLLAACSKPESVNPEGRTFVDTTHTAPVLPK